MSFWGLSSKLNVILGGEPILDHVDPRSIAANAKPQLDSAFMNLPAEIRLAVFEQLWNELGLVHHIIYRNHRYVLSPCVRKEYSPSDGLVDSCITKDNEHGDNHLWKRLRTDWGNHWRCEEAHVPNANLPADSGFLSPLLTCRQLYIECRQSMFNSVTFIIHNLETLYRLAVIHPPLLLHNIKHLRLSISLPVQWEKNKKMSHRSYLHMAHWRESCQVLDSIVGQNLGSVQLWLETSEEVWQAILSSAPRSDNKALTFSDRLGSVLSSAPKLDANPLRFSDKLASILTINLPADSERFRAHETVANGDHRFAVRYATAGNPALSA